MTTAQGDDLRAVAQMKEDVRVKDRLWCWNHAPFIYTVLTGFLGLFAWVLLWASHLQSQVNGHEKYVEAERQEGLVEKVHTNVSNGQRRDRQIERLNTKVFGLPDP